MSTMIEKVAKVLADNACDGRDYTDVARAAIEAMREPTDAMVMAGVDADHTLEAIEGRPDYPESCANIYRAMIDAALNEQVSE